MAEHVNSWSANGRTNVFGQTVKLVRSCFGNSRGIGRRRFSVKLHGLIRIDAHDSDNVQDSRTAQAMSHLRAEICRNTLSIIHVPLLI